MCWNFVVVDEAFIDISDTIINCFGSRSSISSVSETNFASFNFINGYFINGETRNLVIGMIEGACDYKLNLYQRRAFKNAMKDIKSQNSDEITPLDLIENFVMIPLLAKLSAKMKQHLL